MKYTGKFKDFIFFRFLNDQSTIFTKNGHFSIIYFANVGNFTVFPFRSISFSFFIELKGDIRTKNFKFSFLCARVIAGKLPRLNPTTPISSFFIPLFSKYLIALFVFLFMDSAVTLPVLSPNPPYSGAKTPYPFCIIALYNS